MVLTSAELVLRIAEVVLLSFEKSSRVDSSKKTFNILVLGESTSTRLFSTDGMLAWPDYLEQSLKSINEDITVHNQSIPNINTAYIAKNISTYIEKFKPNILITMIGVNDSEYATHLSEVSYLKELKVFKLYRWIVDLYYYYRSRNYFRPLQHLDPNKFFVLKDNLLKLLNSTMKEDDILKSINKELSIIKPTHRYYYLIELCRVSFSASVDNSVRVAYSLCEEAKSLEAPSFIHFSTAIHIYAIVDPELCINESLKTIELTGSLPPSVQRTVLKCVNDSRLTSEDHRETIKALGLHYNSNNGTPFSSTRLNLKHIYKLALKNKTEVFAMQYPTASIDCLKHSLTDNNPKFNRYRDCLIKENPFAHDPPRINSEYNLIHFVSNQNNFNDALKTKNKGDLFTDKFASTFGHTTKKGHLMIRDRIFEEIINKSNSLKHFLHLNK